MKEIVGGGVAVLMVAMASAPLPSATAQQYTLVAPNNTPLFFGMSADDVSQALGVPLNYVRG